MTEQKSRTRESVDKILMAIMQKGIISQPEIRELTELGRTTISKELKHLKQKGYINFVRVPQREWGRPSHNPFWTKLLKL